MDSPTISTEQTSNPNTLPCVGNLYTHSKYGLVVITRVSTMRAQIGAHPPVYRAYFLVLQTQKGTWGTYTPVMWQREWTHIA